MRIALKKILLLFICFFPSICFSMEADIDMDTAIQSLIKVTNSNNMNDTASFIRMWEQRNGNNLLPPHNSQNLLDEKDKGGNTFLHVTTCQENMPLVTWLLERGANINAQNKDGFTPLHNLISQKDIPLPMMSFLLSKNADPNIPNLQDYTCLGTAMWSSQGAAISLLVEHDAKMHTDEPYYSILNRKKIFNPNYQETNKEKLFSLLSRIPTLLPREISPCLYFFVICSILLYIKRK